MAQVRPIAEVLTAQPTLEGGGVHLRRAFGHEQLPKFDPFLLLDEFRSDNPEDYREGFPSHPHRGFETITYMLAGSIEHRDVLGNRGTIHAGGVQWMTAGSGIIHEEMPEGDPSGLLWGLQLWANLPAAQKMTPPRYQGFDAGEIPEITVSGGRVRIIAGEVNGVRGPVRDVAIAPEYLDVNLPPGTPFTHAVPPGHTVFALVLDGQGCFAGEGDQIGEGQVVHYGDGDLVAVSTTDSSVRFILVSGKPLNEPVAWRGPVVMNTQEELREAFRELEEGTFIKG
ncbi:MAG: pirin family protein [Armatimonadota bacterium]